MAKASAAVWSLKGSIAFGTNTLLLPPANDEDEADPCKFPTEGDAMTFPSGLPAPKLDDEGLAITPSP
jgi:hypothetical protein